MKRLTKRVLVLNGSVRENGNTDALLSAFAQGVNEAGLSVRIVALRELNINDCAGCCQ